MSGSGDASNAAAPEKGPSIHTDVDSPKGHVVDQASKGFSTNGNNYDTYRPGYTDVAVQKIADLVTAGMSNLDKDVLYHVLELGAGTGKLTQQLVKRLPSTVRYMATEPSRNFLDTLEAKGLGVDVALSSVDNLPIPEAKVQTVVCGQSFHWFADAPNLEKIRRVMVPGGKLILIWNVDNLEDSWMKPMAEQRMKLIEKIGGKLEHLVNNGLWRREIDRSPSFSLEEYLNLPGNNVVGDLEMIISNVATISAYNMLPDQERKSYLDELREIIRNWPGVDLDNLTMLMSTLLVVYEAK